MITIIMNQILKMLILLLVGVLCYRIHLIDDKGNKSLANLLLLVVNPCVALNAYQVDYDPVLAKGLLYSFGLAFLTHAIGVVLTQLLIKKEGNPNYAIDRFSAMYANCGFIGIPLVRSVLGNEGVFYLTAYMTTFNFFSWTHGVILMTGKTSKEELKQGLINPMVIASLLGIITYVVHFRFPEVCGDSLNYISNMNTPLAMIIAGVAVAQSNPLEMLKRKQVYLVTVLKHFVMPGIVLAILAAVHVNSMVAYTILISAACPVAATCTAFSLRFKKDQRYASELYAFSTLCSLVTIPIMLFFADKVLGA